MARELFRREGEFNVLIALFFVSFYLIVGVVLMNGIFLFLPVIVAVPFNPEGFLAVSIMVSVGEFVGEVLLYVTLMLMNINQESVCSCD